MDKKKIVIGGSGILSILVTVLLLVNSGKSAVCRNGEWNWINQTHAQCSINDRIELCYSLSSTSKTCYIGEIESSQIFLRYNKYKLCSTWRDFPMDRECFIVDKKDLTEFCPLLVNLDKMKCVNDNHVFNMNGFN